MTLSAGTRLGSYEIVAPLGAVFVTPDGKYAVSASGDETLKVWKLSD